MPPSAPDSSCGCLWLVLSLASGTYWLLDLLGLHAAFSLGARDDHTDSSVGTWGGFDLEQRCQGVLSPGGHGLTPGALCTTFSAQTPGLASGLHLHC